MKKAYLLLFLCMIIGILTLEAASAALIDDVIYDFSCDVNGDDELGHATTVTDAGSYAAAYFNNGFIGDGATKYVTYSGMSLGEGCISYFVNYTVVGGNDFAMSDATGNIYWKNYIRTGNFAFGYRSSAGDYRVWDVAVAPSTNTKYHVVWCLNLTGGYTTTAYINNVSQATTLKVTAGNPSGNITQTAAISREGAIASGYVNGVIDEVKILARKYLTASEVEELYLNFTSGAPATTQYFEVTLYDYYDSTLVTTFNVTLDNGSIYQTTNGTVKTNINQSVAGTQNITITATDYITRHYYDVDTTSDLTAYAWQGVAHFYAYNKITGASVSSFTAAVDGQSNTNTTPLIRLKTGDYTANFSKAGYYNTSTSFNISARDNRTINFTVHDVSLNVSATNAYTGQNITSFSGWVYYPDNGFNESFSTSTGHAYINLSTGNYTVFITAPNYAIGSVNYQNVTLANPLEEVNFTLWSNNSVRVNIYDDDTGIKITTTNISVTVSGNTTENTYYTVTGFLFVSNLTDGNYTFKFQGGNYTLRTYTVTVAAGSTQILNAYLSLTTETVTMTLQDSISGAVIENVACSMSKLINSTWTVVESKSSDITGRLQFTYTPTIKYRFLCTKSGYYNKLFYLDPVIFSSYNVLMQKIVTQADETHYSGISINILPSRYNNSENHSFTFQINSPDGALESYGFLLEFPGASPQTGKGTNSYGSILTADVNISGASLLDTVNLTFWYDTTFTDNRTYKRLYIIDGATNPYTFKAAGEADYGFTAFEMIMIAVIGTIILGGAGFLFVGPVGGGTMAIFAMAIFLKIGFISLWLFLPSALLGLVILLWGAKT